MSIDFESLTVLIVDDEAYIQKLLTHQLQSLGVKNIHNREEAMAALTLVEAQSDVELIICDLQMPGMDGVEFIRHVANLGYQGNLMLMSGEDTRILQSAENFARSNGLSVVGAFRKPVPVATLQRLLSLAVNGGRDQTEKDSREYSATELQQAIKNGELVNFYQPKVDLATGVWTGMEALVRWRHPRDGLVFPDRFIMLAETEGLIDDLTQVVLRNTLIDSVKWRNSNPQHCVSVNVPICTLTNIAFPEELITVLNAFDFPLTNLQLEITESQVMQNPKKVLDVLTRLRLKGIKLSIDDFGTGFSSLSQLRDIPFTELKIDRSFITGAARDHSLNAIVEGSLGIAQKIGLQTVAEGVEDADDWYYLLEKPCDLAQGYFIARPMPADELSKWEKDWKQRYQALQD